METTQIAVMTSRLKAAEPESMKGEHKLKINKS